MKRILFLLSVFSFCGACTEENLPDMSVSFSVNLNIDNLENKRYSNGFATLTVESSGQFYQSDFSEFFTSSLDFADFGSAYVNITADGFSSVSYTVSMSNASEESYVKMLRNDAASLKCILHYVDSSIVSSDVNLKLMLVVDSTLFYHSGGKTSVPVFAGASLMNITAKGGVFEIALPADVKGVTYRLLADDITTDTGAQTLQPLDIIIYADKHTVKDIYYSH